ncbi:MAG: hypothetical protein PHR20_03205 [Bacteroidales bacterium]|nr:hypothetical protein [Bacteroidales bacterium]
MFFKDIQGNDSVKRQLVQMADDKRISHALLFNGPEGSAKLQLAIAFVRYLNCKNKSNGDSCGVCPSCLQINKLAHPDLHFIYPIGNSKLKKIKDPVSSDFIEEWRSFVDKTSGLGTLNDWLNELKIESGQGIINALDCSNIVKTLSYTSYESKYKIMIIWMAENIFYAAAPKILKVLEEPPENTLFILITDNRNAILDTILSRTQTINIPEFTNDDIKNILINKYAISTDEARKVAEMSDGNASIAMNYVLMPEVRALAFEEFMQWMRVCMKANMNELLPYVDEVSKKGREGIIFFLKSSMALLRQALYMNVTGKMIIPMPDNQTETFAKFARFVTINNIDKFDYYIEKAISNIGRNGYVNLVMVNLTINLCRVIKSS